MSTFQSVDGFTTRIPSYRWRRPRLQQSDYETAQHIGDRRLRLMLIDIAAGSAYDALPRMARAVSDRDSEPTLLLYGITERGCFVCIQVRGFLPYFFMRVPPSVRTEADLEGLRVAFRATLSRASNDPQRNDYPQRALRAEIVHRLEMFPLTADGVSRYRSILEDEPVGVIRVSVTTPGYVSSLRNALEKEETDRRVVDSGGREMERVETYESDMTYTLRYMIDNNIVGGGWFEVDLNNEYSAPITGMCSDASLIRTSHRVPNGTEFVVDHRRVRGVGVDECGSVPAQGLRVLSFDIECCGEAGRFPTADRNPIITICAVAQSIGGSVGDATHRVVFQLNTCAAIDGCAVMTFRTERELLKAFNTFFTEYDPDFVTGYNTDNFDLRYCCDRAAVFNMQLFLGRDRRASETKKKTFSSGAYGNLNWETVEMRGRMSIDAVRVIRREHKLRSYRLDDVAKHFLNDQKNDVSHKQIPRLFRGNAEMRQRLARYCMKDAELPLELFNKMAMGYSMIEMGRATGVPLNFLLDRGAQIRAISGVYRDARAAGVLVIHMSQAERDAQEEAIQSYLIEQEDIVDENAIANENAAADDSPIAATDDAAPKKRKMVDGSLSAYFGVPSSSSSSSAAAVEPARHEAVFDGAIVLEALRGYYQTPITTLDFASLYPSIMQAYNLCLSTFIRGGIAEARRRYSDPAQYTTVPGLPHVFRSVTVTRGIIPQTLTRFLTARRAAKVDMEAAKARGDMYQYKIFNLRQMNLKIAANAIYGMTGATVGRLSLVPVAESVTAFGRYWLERTRHKVEKWYSMKRGCVHDAKVVYGDSVTSDTPVLCRVPNGTKYRYFYREISELATADDVWTSMGVDDKQQVVPVRRIEVWSDEGFTPIVRIIRHRCRKEIRRVLTRTGAVDVTVDHSLLDSDGERIKPSEVTVGSTLLHRALPRLVHPDETTTVTSIDEMFAAGRRCRQESLSSKRQAAFDDVINAGYNMRDAFWRGYCGKASDMDNLVIRAVGKVAAANLYYIAESLNYNVAVQLTAETSTASNVYHLWCFMPYGELIRPRIAEAVTYNQTCTSLASPQDYVYDLETQNHHFAAGIGRMVVHNTDSVMIRFGDFTLEQTRDMGMDAARRMNLIVPRPMSLEWEKMFWPFLLVNKKRYGGRQFDRWLNSEMTTKGMETVRRDVCMLVTDTLTEVLRLVLLENDPVAAVHFMQETLRALRHGEIDFSKLVITKSYSRPASEYRNRQIHIELAKRMEARDPGTAPKVSDRVPYVVVCGAKGEPRWKLGEDPLYAMQHGVPLDIKWYLENQLERPLSRILVPVIGASEFARLMDEGRKQSLASTVAASSGAQAHGIRRFLVERHHCIVCLKTPTAYEGEICSSCTPLEIETAAAAARMYATECRTACDRQWDVCRRCQGIDYGVIECDSQGCQHFYRRQHLRIAARDAERVAARF